MTIETPAPSADGAPATPTQPKIQTPLKIHPHARVLVLPVIWTAVYAAALLAIVLQVGNTVLGRALFALVGIVGGAAWLYLAVLPAIAWYRTSYVFTTDRVLVNRGLFPTAEQADIPLIGVNEVHVRRHGWDLVFGSGTLQLGQNREDESKWLAHVPRVKWMKNYVIALVDQVHGRGVDAIALEQIVRRLFGRSYGHG
jgi:hypothetical protein